MSRNPAATPHVLVVGAGFGGLAAVRALRHAPVQVTLLDAHNYHLFTPLLYQVASALLDPSEIAHPVRAILRGQDNATFRLGRLTGLNLAERTAQTSSGPIGYDRLVLATGSVTNFFGNQALAEHVHGLKDLGEALALRNHVLTCFERAAVTADPARRAMLGRIVVVGAGPTGVECSGAFAELVGLVLRRDFHDGALGKVAIDLLEAGPHLLGTFAGSLQRSAERRLEHKGVRVRLGTGVASADDHGVVLQSGTRIDAATVVWTAGVQAGPAAGLLGVDRVRGGRVPVDAWLRLEGHPEVSVIGDAAAVQGAGGPHPMLAPVAIQQGQFVARRIAAEAAGAVADQPFRYRDKGTMATIGRNAGIAQIGPIRAGGLLGWLMWLFVHLVQIVGFRNRVVVLINWAWDYFFYDRPVRLITAAARRADDDDPAEDAAPPWSGADLHGRKLEDQHRTHQGDPR